MASAPTSEQVAAFQRDTGSSGIQNEIVWLPSMQ